MLFLHEPIHNELHFYIHTQKIQLIEQSTQNEFIFYSDEDIKQKSPRNIGGFTKLMEQYLIGERRYLFPLNGRWWLTTDIVNDTGNTIYFIDDAV